MSATSGTAVTVSVPSFGANQYVRKAVESLLSQTHKELTVVVVNDGHSSPPWRQLAHLRDPRLVRFNLEENHGPYFVHQVVLAASNTPYFLIHDADDWSADNRVSALLNQLLANDSDLAFSAWLQYLQDENGAFHPVSIRWRRKKMRSTANSILRRFLTLWKKDEACKVASRESFVFDPVLTDEFINRASHHGVFRRTALQRIGGCYGGFRINHDTLLTNLLLMTGRVSFVADPLYHYRIRSDSLSHSRATGARSQARTQIRAQQADIYKEAFARYRKCSQQEMTREDLVACIRELATQFVTASDREAIDREAARLSAVMHRCSKFSCLDE